MNDSKYSYSEALALTERTMKWTHTRKYCTIVCKGRCCEECTHYECLKGKRRLLCGLYICIELRRLLQVPDLYERYWYELLRAWRKETGTHPLALLTPEITAKFNPPKEYIDWIIKTLNSRRRRKIMVYLVKRKVDIIRHGWWRKRSFWHLRRLAYKYSNRY